MQILELTDLPQAIKTHLENEHVTPDFQAELQEDMYCVHWEEPDGCVLLVFRIIDGYIYGLLPTRENDPYFNWISDTVHGRLA